MVPQKEKKLRSGYTTGACAAAAAKGATLCLLLQNPAREVIIPFPDGVLHRFELCRCRLEQDAAMASVVKDAGDDPDVTNGAEIGAVVRLGPLRQDEEAVIIQGGEGVGRMTKPGLPVGVGEPAINPVPRKMIRAAVKEAVTECGESLREQLEVTIFVRDGEVLAEKTLNSRLGILGGISILGTTGIVRPVSAKAWTDTIDASMKVAKAAGLEVVMLSTGRTSEAAARRERHLPEEAQVMMGDYLAYGLKAAKRHGFRSIYLAGMWGKLLKAAMQIPQTHVRHGVLEIPHAARFLEELGLDMESAGVMAGANTAREMYIRLREQGRTDIIRAVLGKAREYAERRSGLEVTVYLVTSEDGVVERNSSRGF
ncbi:MAG: cobalt-precorrin-5B (C(1))-methyltransferase [Desulfobulbaceae bacterium]|nr:cobalt-precorrin-5B (C(1))-methyltransferase [Desulfobulbaceae bacterium]